MEHLLSRIVACERLGCSLWEDPGVSLLAGAKAHVTLNTYAAGCSCQPGTPSLEWAAEVGLVYMNQVDSSHGLAERLGDQGEPLCLEWELAPAGSLPSHNVECWLPHQYPKADFSSGEEVMEKANQAMERLYRASKNLLWSVCWYLADNTLKVFLCPKRSSRPPWCWFSNRVSATSAMLGEAKWKKIQP